MSFQLTYKQSLLWCAVLSSSTESSIMDEKINNLKKLITIIVELQQGQRFKDKQKVPNDVSG